jgi:hypothetical protein
MPTIIRIFNVRRMAVSGVVGRPQCRPLRRGGDGAWVKPG